MGITLYEQGFILGESKIRLKSDSERAIHSALKEIKHQRLELVKYIRKHLEFQYSLKPVEALPEAPKIVRMMVESSRMAKVGPMASVGGAFADIGMEALLRDGARTAVVEDGGEIAASVAVPVVVSIFSSNMSVSGKIGFTIVKEDCPLGIATSSSKTSRVLSFGEADSVTVIAESASLADAAATAICNSVVEVNVEESIKHGLKRAQTIRGVRGVIITREDSVGIWGKLPKIVRIK